jgi:hypothetical protein
MCSRTTIPTDEVREGNDILADIFFGLHIEGCDSGGCVVDISVQVKGKVHVQQIGHFEQGEQHRRRTACLMKAKMPQTRKEDGGAFELIWTCVG